MARNKTNTHETNKFNRSIPLYRKLVFIIGFLLIVPIVAITTLYIVTYRRSTTVVWDQTSTNPTEHRGFTTMTTKAQGQHVDSFVFNTGAITLTFRLNADDLTPEHVYGVTYQFNLSATINEGHRVVSNIAVDMIIQADWQDARSSQVSRNVNFSTLAPQNNINIIFNHRINPSLWFINETHPNLYVRVRYSVPGALGNVAVEHFAVGDLTLLRTFVAIVEE